MRNDYYVYGHYLTESDTTPFYIGKGCHSRAYSNTGRNKQWHELVSDNNGYLVKLIKENLSEKDALVLETNLIKEYGMQVNGTGCLVNKTIVGVISKQRQSIPIEIENQIKITMKKLAILHKRIRVI